MTITIGTNVLAGRIQRNLASASSLRDTASERLASGRRINRASDDAAGLSISMALNTRGRLFSGAIRNINDGISLISIADAALENQSSILDRLSELAQQSASGSYSTTQRASVQREYSSLVKEYERIAKSTSFNQIQLLDPAQARNTVLQAGITGDAQAQISVASTANGAYTGTQAITTDTDGDGDVDVLDLGVTSPYLNNAVFYADVGALSSAVGGAVFEQSVVDSTGTARTVYVAPTLYDFNGSGLATNAQTLWTVFGQDGAQFRSLSPSYGTIQAANSSLSIPISFLSGATTTVALDLTNVTFRGTNDPSGPVKRVSIPSSVVGGTGVETASRAREALDATTNARNTVSSLRSTLGAISSRLSTSLSIAAVSRDTSVSAESRITDADVAQEAAELVRTNILQSAATSLLAQAAGAPSIAIQLLGT